MPHVVILHLRENLDQLAPKDVKARLVIKAPLDSPDNLVTLELKDKRYFMWLNMIFLCAYLDVMDLIFPLI